MTEVDRVGEPDLTLLEHGTALPGTGSSRG